VFLPGEVAVFISKFGTTETALRFRFHLVARHLAGHERVLSSGTFLDGLRRHDDDPGHDVAIDLRVQAGGPRITISSNLPSAPTNWILD